MTNLLKFKKHADRAKFNVSTNKLKNKQTYGTERKKRKFKNCFNNCLEWKQTPH